MIGKAAALYDGLQAVQTQSYGPEARGGASRTELVISDEEIDYPKVQTSRHIRGNVSRSPPSLSGKG